MPEVTDEELEATARAIVRCLHHVRIGASGIDQFVDDCWQDFMPEASAAIAAYNATPRMAKILEEWERYQQLLFCVGNRYPGESRHETALRYILQAEQPSDNCAARAAEIKP